jgi:hypothetical protein
MSTHPQSTWQGRWSELLLGGAAAGVGAPLLLGGLRRFLHPRQRGAPDRVGWAAGLLGALVAGGLTCRRLQRACAVEKTELPLKAPVGSESRSLMSAEVGEDADEGVADRRREARRRRLAALELRATTHSEAPGHEVPRAVERRSPRRGPSGREQPWHEALASTSG